MASIVLAAILATAGVHHGAVLAALAWSAGVLLFFRWTNPKWAGWHRPTPAAWVALGPCGWAWWLLVDPFLGDGGDR